MREPVAIRHDESSPRYRPERQGIVELRRSRTLASEQGEMLTVRAVCPDCRGHPICHIDTTGTVHGQARHETEAVLLLDTLYRVFSQS